MLSQKAKDLFAKLGMEYPAVALKYCYSQPEGVEHVDKTLSFCEFVKEAQTSGKKFFITKEDDNCFGKMVLGMIPKPGLGASGQAGYDFGCYKSPVGCQQLYQKLPILEPHTINYVEFCPAADCDFDPDLLFFVADLPQADVIMRATSYISGDLWESKSSPVISCAWMYAYPVITGKVNHITTGYYHGLKRRKAYPAGLRMIAVPFQKLPEFFTALEEMDWTLIAFREDEESKADLQRRIEHWQEMAAAVGSHVDLH